MSYLLKLSPFHRRVRTGFTLVEALIAITMTLIIMLALAQGFKQLSGDISQGRARLSLSDQLRGVSEILRSDLSGLTVHTDPTAKTSKSGYFLYYEGPLADHHPLTVPINNLPGGTTEQQLSTSKYGDFDDILMFTARSKGDWFRGRVPLAIVKGAATGGTYTPTLLDWTTSVVVASEYAEIAYFMMPAITPTPNAAGTYLEYAAAANLTVPIVDNDSPVNPGAIAIAATGNAIPDRFTLCRRVLLILPNLNLPNGQLFSAGGFPANVRLQALPINGGQSARLQLGNAYQRCDLSVRRVQSAIGGLSPIAANSLQDLAAPINRFAHITLPGPVLGLPANDRSMPILSLTAQLPLQQYALGNNVSLALRADSTYPEAGFIRPEFLKRTIDPATGDVVTVEDPLTGGDVELLSNEEIVAANCVAFDLKGYDPVARMLYNSGSDGLPNGAAGWISLGASGTDDLVVSPSDPGYYASLSYLGTGTPAATIDNITASQGAFVDLGWSFKTPFAPTAAMGLVFETTLSGVEGFLPSVALRKSGRVLLAGGAAPVTQPLTMTIYQPCFDSFTDSFDHDGFRQRDRITTSNAPADPVVRGTIFDDGAVWLAGNPNTNNPNFSDLASNGLDDDSNGLIDDYAEQDSSPPILSAMSAIQALIRLEDASASVIQQIAVTQDLVSQ